jgi:hypothetical protein
VHLERTPDVLICHDLILRAWFIANEQAFTGWLAFFIPL